MWGDLSDERTVLSFTMYSIQYIYILHIITWMYIHNIYKASVSPGSVERLVSFVKVLRPTVRRPVCLGIKHPFGAYDQIFITVWWLQDCWCGALSLTRGRVCHLPESVSSTMSVVSMYNLHFIKRMFNVCIYNIYKAFVSPGSVHQIMP
jgi:hypothetical protein